MTSVRRTCGGDRARTGRPPSSRRNASGACRGCARSRRRHRRLLLGPRGARARTRPLRAARLDCRPARRERRVRWRRRIAARPTRSSAVRTCCSCSTRMPCYGRRRPGAGGRRPPIRTPSSPPSSGGRTGRCGPRASTCISTTARWRACDIRETARRAAAACSGSRERASRSRALWERVDGFDDCVLPLLGGRRPLAGAFTTPAGEIRVLAGRHRGPRRGRHPRRPTTRSREVGDVLLLQHPQSAAVREAAASGRTTCERWKRTALRVSWGIVLQGGRRQLVTSLAPWRALSRGLRDGRRGVAGPADRADAAQARRRMSSEIASAMSRDVNRLLDARSSGRIPSRRHPRVVEEREHSGRASPRHPVAPAGPSPRP